MYFLDEDKSLPSASRKNKFRPFQKEKKNSLLTKEGTKLLSSGEGKDESLCEILLIQEREAVIFFFSSLKRRKIYSLENNEVLFQEKK